jgi:amylosucrase
MGDEVAQGNDTRYLADPALAEDNRWMHRPWFDENAAARRHDPSSVEGRVFAALRELVRARAEQPALHAGGESAVLDVGSPHVLAWRRRHPRSGNFVGLVNFAEHPVSFDAHALDGLGELHTVMSSDDAVQVRSGHVHLPGLGYVWLAET